LDTFQTESPTSQDLNPLCPQPQTFIAEAKLNLQTVARQAGEAGDGAEENIVYL
jgi:hypothetical protein